MASDIRHGVLTPIDRIKIQTMTMRRFFLLLGTALVPLLATSQAFAGQFDLNASLLGQVRENASGLKEGPLNGYLGMTLTQPKWHLSGETDMRLFTDASRRWDDYDLYQAVLHIHPLEMLQIDFGRQFLNEGFSAEIADAIRFKIIPPGPVDVTLYSGIPRTVETGDFDRNNGLLTGLSLGLKNVPRTSAQIHVAWRKNNIRGQDLRENDDILAGANLSHQFSFRTRPMFYGLIEYDATARVLSAGTLGVDLYPHKRVSVTAEFNNFNANRSSDRATILGLFTRGRLTSGRLASTWTLIPDWLDLTESYSYQRVEERPGTRSNGHLLDTALKISIDSIGLHLTPGYYFSKSWGGTLHGGRLFALEHFTDKISAEAGFDFTRYSKITGNDDNAYSGVLWTRYTLPKGFAVAGGFEYNSNNAFRRDIRGSFRLDYHFGHAI